MTDLERFVDLYKSFGIDCKVTKIYNEDEEVWQNEIILINDTIGSDSYWNVELTKSTNFNGYTDFYTSIVFTDDGKFKSQGFWE